MITTLKKGVVKSLKKGMVNTKYVGSLENINVNWYYNYDLIRHPQYKKQLFNKDPTDIEFIPMVRTYNINNLKTVFTTPPPFLLAFNEPDSNISPDKMSPSEMLKLWPLVESVKPKMLSCPSVMKKNIYTWLPEFFNGNGLYKPRVDFIPLHLYNRDAKTTLNDIDKCWITFKKPIWITEFSIADYSVSNPTFTDNEKIAFFNLIIPELEKRPYVLRYSYFCNLNDPNVKDGTIWTTDTIPLLNKYGIQYISL